MLSPGDVIERYEVERELGGGGMARVYKVHHVALGSVHALKVLDPELVVNAEIRARFLDEGRIQARLKHPNILGITDVVAAPGVAGLVMDYLEGESLDKYLARVQQPPEPQEVRDIFLQVLAAVGFAHEQGVIHRDLKPSNVFLEQSHGRRVVRILDFGIAKVTNAEGRPTTRTGVRMGTPQYMSPEQIRGARDVTVRSDIFSLGVTLYELATGHVCFQGESDFNIMEKVVRAEYVPPEVAHPGLERRLLASIRRAMDLDPERRFASCQEFAAALVAEAPVEQAEPPVQEAPPAPRVATPVPVPAPRVATPAPVPEASGSSLFHVAKSPQIPKPATRQSEPEVSSALVEAMRRAPRPPGWQPPPGPVRTPAAPAKVVPLAPAAPAREPEPVARAVEAPRAPAAPVREPEPEPAAPVVVAPPAAPLRELELKPESEPEPLEVARQAPAAPVREPEPEPIPQPAARVMDRQAPVLETRLAEPAPLAPIEKSAPAPARERQVPAKSAPQSGQADAQARPSRKAWLFALLLALAGVGVMLGLGLQGMRAGPTTPPSQPAPKQQPEQPAPMQPAPKQKEKEAGASVPRPGGAPVTPPPRTERAGARDESLVIEVRPARRTTLELTDPKGRQRKVSSPYTDPKPTPGVWHVMARAPGYEAERWTVEVTPGKPARLRERLTSLAGADSP
jgi:serine/threonine-protein kinase